MEMEHVMDSCQMLFFWLQMVCYKTELNRLCPLTWFLHKKVSLLVQCAVALV